MNEYLLQSEAEMRQLGERLGAQLRGGDVVELVGDVGAGKTTFTKGLARGLGIDEEVQSPTFTLNRVHEAPDDRRLVHYDFYRLNDAGILADELADSIQQPDTITVIEWASIVEGVLPTDHIVIRIVSPTESSRRVTIEGMTA